MSYLFKRRAVRAKSKPAQKTESNGFKAGDESLRTLHNQQPSANSFLDAKKLRRVQLRGWK